MILIPAAIWGQAQTLFRRNRKKVEQVCFLDGYRVGSLGIVTTLTFPKARVERGYYYIEPDQVRTASKHLRSNSMVRLAQVHTHPSSWTGHSQYDDEHAYSGAPGALSIVLPFYARMDCSLDNAGVHLRNEYGWVEIPTAGRGGVVALVPSLVDLRVGVR